MQGKAPTRIMITGARRGLGKTSITINLAFYYVNKGLKTLLIEPAWSQTSIPYQELFQNHNPRYLQISLDSPPNLENEEADIILFDLGFSQHFPYWQKLGQFQIILIISLPNFYSLVESYVLLKMLDLSFDSQLALVINRAQKQESFLETIKTLKALANQYLSQELVWLGVLPEYLGQRLFPENLPILAKNPKEEFSQRISELGEKLLKLCPDSSTTLIQKTQRRCSYEPALSRKP